MQDPLIETYAVKAKMIFDFRYLLIGEELDVSMLEADYDCLYVPIVNISSLWKKEVPLKDSDNGSVWVICINIPGEKGYAVLPCYWFDEEECTRYIERIIKATNKTKGGADL